MKRLKQLFCGLFKGHDYVLHEFIGSLGENSTWKCKKCGHLTGTEVEVTIKK